jgi:hypothetical protein
MVHAGSMRNSRPSHRGAGGDGSVDRRRRALLFHRIVADQAFPLELKVPNAETRAAMEEADQLMKARKSRFKSATRCSRL